MIAENDLKATFSMVDAGRAQITELQRKIDTSGIQIAEAESWLQTIRQGNTQRASEMLQVNTRLATKEHEYSQSVHFARLAQNTLREGRTLKDCAVIKRDLVALKKSHVDLAATYAAENEAAEEQERTLQDALVKLRTEQASAQEQLNAAQTCQSRAHDELGELMLIDWKKRYEVKSATVADLRNQLHEALSELDLLHNHGISELADYPAQLKAFKLLQVPVSPVERVLMISLQAIQVYIDDMEHVDLEFVKAGLEKGYEIFHITKLDPRAKEDLRERCKVLQRALDDAVQWEAKKL